ncbi:YjbQ family protein [Planctomycetales bacterium ZRK34]|nr:YjbQ family protein [Planctomycetales bacterium ZRK34]
MDSFNVQTDQRDQMVEITDRVRRVVEHSGVQSGAAIVYVPHTTAGVTINENADPDVVHDFLKQLDVMVPWRQPFYRHAEGNSASHVKASMMGFSAHVIIERGRLVLGTWQGIWFCEFDGPRQRKVHVQVMPAITS